MTSLSRQFYKDLMKKNLVDFGFCGWMADFGEYSPIEARSQSGQDWWGQDHGEILHQVQRTLNIAKNYRIESALRKMQNKQKCFIVEY